MVISYRPLPRRVLRTHAQTSRNYTWLRENWQNIHDNYAGEFIAVAGREVVFNTKNHKELLRYLSEHRNRADMIAVRVRLHDEILLL